MKKIFKVLILCGPVSWNMYAQQVDPYLPDTNGPVEMEGYKLVWNEEFEVDGKPDPKSWKYETGFMRNEELQWYQSDNASCSEGLLKIEGRREKVKNPNYQAGSSDWKKNREYADYTSSSINSQGKHSWQYGRFDIRARIPAYKGSWPAIWTLGVSKEWPSNGEIDIMEYYLIGGRPCILANAAWGTSQRWVPKWDSEHKEFSYFLAKDPDWADKFHLWRMDWDEDYIRIYLDGELMNEIRLAGTVNADGSNPFRQKHYILLNLALGGNGGNPSGTTFPLTYEVDYVRIYQEDHSSGTGNGRQQLSSPVRPNPATDYISVEMPGARVDIFDLSGCKVMSRSILFAGEQMDISVLPEGMYYVRLSDGIKNEICKLIRK